MSGARSGGKHNYVLNICVICALILTSALVFPQSAFAEFKTAVKTIWHDAFSIIIDTLKLKPCWNLIWEFIHH